jgi:iron complex transport system ATP-binding protein
MTRAVDIQSLAYAYGRTQVLENVTFSVAEGDFFVIIGPNGSGKTTLMKMMAGIQKPAAGRVTVMGRPISRYNRKVLAQTIAYVPQNMPSDFPFSVREIVMMGRTPYQGMLGLESEADRVKAEQAIAFTGIEHLAGRRLSQLSGGECQRVFIARAICQEPRLILLDEPTASLDLSHQVRIMDLMEKLRAEKQITVVMVSHDVNLAAMYGDRLLLLDKGRITEIGSPGKVLTYQTLEKSYGCTLLVDESPLGEFPRVTPVPGRFMKKNKITL